MPDRVAILVPCRNEEATVADVVEGFRSAIPDCTVYVYDNNSTDRTAEIAREAGAVVRAETLPGKGNVVRRMFSDIDADIYVMVDGDATYDATIAPKMVNLIKSDSLDMVVATRQDEDKNSAAYRVGHRAGNKTLTRFTGWLFGSRFTDILSGYRAFSRRFVKSFPALATGFEIETELTIHALEMKMPVDEVQAVYLARPEGSASKLNTYSDGIRIMTTIIFLFKEIRPFKFFGAIFLALFVLSLAFAYPLIVTFIETGLVPRLPTAILTTGIMLLAFISLACGTILDSVCRGRREAKRMYYLAQPKP
ncbi:MAG: glycosyltransferase [Alphaproteobacteria bacterium]|nr:glycosyltransferase [Alphaproteobacteria bacterium]